MTHVSGQTVQERLADTDEDLRRLRVAISTSARSSPSQITDEQEWAAVHRQRLIRLDTLEEERAALLVLLEAEEQELERLEQTMIDTSSEARDG